MEQETEDAVRKSNPIISIIVPVYNEANNIEPLIRALEDAIETSYTEWTLLFIDDGSIDDTLQELRRLSRKKNRVRYISLSRNFGHQSALRAGLLNSNGDCIISMDGDLQHPPELINQMLKEWHNGADIVSSIRINEDQAKIFKKITSLFYYKIFSYLAGIKIENGAADFRLIDKKVLKILNSFNEQDLFLRGIIPWIGFKNVYINYKANARFRGKSQYNLKKMIGLAADGIFAFSTIPLRIASVLGIAVSIVAFMYSMYAFTIFCINKTVVSGWTSLLISVLFLGGVQLISIGLMGEYISRILRESKQRPCFIINEKSF